MELSVLFSYCGFFLVQESLLSEIIPHDHVAYVCVAKGPEGKIIWKAFDIVRESLSPDN